MAIKLVIKRRGQADEAVPPAGRIFTGNLISIGSDPAATLRLQGAGIAPEQAVIVSEDGQTLLINRADGTELNDEGLPREARRALAEGDKLCIGEYVIGLAASQETSLPAADNGSSPADQTHNESATPVGAADSAAALEDDEEGVRPRTEGENSPRNFAAILDSLRTEEDSFYFLIESEQPGQTGRRVIVERAMMPLGWDEGGHTISFEPTAATPRAILRKDWSGVVVQAQSAGMIAVNGAPVEDAYRLRNGDRLTLAPAADAPEPNSTQLVFHEPASLVVLDSLLPQKLPPPVSLRAAAATATTTTTTTTAAAESDAKAGVPTAAAAPSEQRPGLFSPDQKYFGYFTLTEVVMMGVGTLFTAAIIFFILEWAVSA